MPSSKPMGRMILGAFAGGLTLLASMAVAYFWPAGTIHLSRPWVYLALFALSVVVITTDLAIRDPALLGRRLVGGPLAEPEPLQRVLQSIANVAFLLLYVVAGFDARFHWSSVSPTLAVVSDVVVLLGFAIVFLTFRANSFTSATIRVADDQQVVDRGPYALVRHPMYAGALLLLAGTPLALGSWWALLAVVPLAATIVARLLDEERYLARNLHGYSEYQQRVGHRLMPFVW